MKFDHILAVVGAFSEDFLVIARVVTCKMQPMNSDDPLLFLLRDDFLYNSKTKLMPTATSSCRQTHTVVSTYLKMCRRPYQLSSTFRSSKTSSEISNPFLPQTTHFLEFFIGRVVLVFCLSRCLWQPLSNFQHINTKTATVQEKNPSRYGQSNII